MLGKLIKYDLKFVYKQLIIFYIIILCLAVIARLTANIEDNFLIKFLHEFTQGAALGFSFGMVINASMRMWAKYKYSMYGDQSYLTHTLPLTRRTIWTAKFFAGIAIITLSLVLFIIALLIMFLSQSFIDVFIEHGGTMWLLVFAFVLTIFGQFCYIMQCGLVGITFGHLFSSSRMPLSVVFGIAMYIIGGLIILGVCFLWGNFDPTIQNILLTGDMSNPDNIAKLIAGIGTMYLILIVGTYFLNYALLQRGVNVD